MPSDTDDEPSCIITNETEPVDNWTVWDCPEHEEDVETQLVNAWGLSPNSSPPLICGNQIRLRVDLGETYDSGNWALVPELTILKEIAVKALLLEHSAEAWPSYLKSFPMMERAYKFVYFCGAPNLLIRFNNDFPQNANSFVLHKKPFENLPAIRSSAHPYFVIANVAQTVLRQRAEKIQVAEQPSAIQECLDLCIVIYRQWLSLSIKRPAQPALDNSSRSDSSATVNPKTSQPNRASSSAQNQGRAKQGKHVLSDSEYEPPANKSLRASR